VLNGKLQVGIVGAGSIGRDQHLPGWAKVPFAEVIAAADVSAEALERAAQIVPLRSRFSDWRQLVALEELDVVDICTPNRTHAEIALTALANGKHVLCEKPLATTSAEARAMCAAARQANRLLMAAQHLRFDPVARQLKGLIEAGKTGDIYYARAQWLRRRMLPARPTFVERELSGGGPALDVGVHVVDLAYWYLGAPQPVRVSSQVSCHLAHNEHLSGSWGDWDRSRFDVEDFAVAMVHFANGATLTLETSWLAFQPEPEIIRLQCFGSRAGLVWPDGVLVGETNRVPWKLQLSETPKAAPHHEEIREFAQAVRDGLPSPVPPEESLRVVQIIEAIYRSSQAQAEVRIEES
jgi:predicted dehydrogenase